MRLLLRCRETKHGRTAFQQAGMCDPRILLRMDTQHRACDEWGENTLNPDTERRAAGVNRTRCTVVGNTSLLYYIADITAQIQVLFSTFAGP